MGPPAGLQDIYSVGESRGIVNVMGVVVDHLPSSPTRGTDWQCTFSIADTTSRLEGQRVKVFSSPISLPPIRGTGDVVILRHFKATDWKGQQVVLSSWDSQWTVFHCCNIPDESPSGGQLHIECATSKKALKPKEAELRYAIELCNMKSRYEWESKDSMPNAASTAPDPTGTAAASFREKFSLIESICVDKYYDLVGQVVKMWSTGNRLDLYLTDYTENTLLYNYGDESRETAANSSAWDGDEYGYLESTTRKKKQQDWKGPKGRYTFTATLFAPHASYAESKLKPDDYVLLRNVHVKLGKDPSSSRLEGVIHTDMTYPERINVEKITPETDERAKALLRRKKHFIEMQRDVMNDPNDNSKDLKRKHDDHDGKELSKRRAKNLRKKERDATKKRKSKFNDATSKSDAQGDSSKPSTTAVAALEANKYIVAAHSTKPLRTIQDVNNTEKTHNYTPPNSEEPIILPFQNVIFRTKVRVVDFQPSQIEDFAVRTSEFDLLSDAEDEEPNNNEQQSQQRNSLSPSISSADEDSDTPSRKRWTWFFTLLLDDASSTASKSPDDRIAVHVADEDAEFLLGLDAANLRRKPERLEQLREKLFVLWGELEERKNGRRDKGSVETSEGSNTLSETSGNSLKSAPEGKQQGQGDEKKTAPKESLAASKEDVPAGKPFVCCIKEYGVKSGGEWQRRFRMFGTSIQ